jgi:hypothetical protein
LAPPDGRERSNDGKNRPQQLCVNLFEVAHGIVELEPEASA